jgi:hypothetical protein
MRVRVLDPSALASPGARRIRLYLRLNGWAQEITGQGGPDVWSRQAEGDVYEVIAPSQTARDFTSRVSELLNTLSVVEDRSESDVLRDLLTVTFDVQYLRTGHEGPPGTAPLRDAADAVAAAHNLLASATAALEEPRLVQPSRRPAKTTDFMRKVLAGPTSVGSFVISTWVPIPPRLSPEEDQVLFDDPNEPFERQATRHLSRALAAAQHASDEALSSDAGLDAFLAREQDGISANLCEALVALAGEQEVPLGITLAWALDRPMQNLPSEFSFPTESISVLREAARELRQRLPEEVVRVRGNVVRLHRDAVSGAGDVTIAGIVSGDDLGKLRRISASLAEEDYEQAIEAHQQFSEVEIVGGLYQKGTRTYLRDARGFAALPAAAEVPGT